MQRTANLDLPYILPNQAQKHVTHNEAIRALDAIVQLAVIDRDRTAAPEAPQEGDRYIVAANAQGLFAGQKGRSQPGRMEPGCFIRQGWAGLHG